MLVKSITGRYFIYNLAYQSGSDNQQTFRKQHHIGMSQEIVKVEELYRAKGASSTLSKSNDQTPKATANGRPPAKVQPQKPELKRELQSRLSSHSPKTPLEASLGKDGFGYMSRQQDMKRMPGQPMTTVKRHGQLTNSDIEPFLEVKKKARKVMKSIVQTQSRVATRQSRQSRLMAPSPPLSNFIKNRDQQQQQSTQEPSTTLDVQGAAAQAQPEGLPDRKQMISIDENNSGEDCVSRSNGKKSADRSYKSAGSTNQLRPLRSPGSGKEDGVVKIFDTYNADDRDESLDRKGVNKFQSVVDSADGNSAGELPESVTPKEPSRKITNESTPIKKTNLSMFLEEARNERTLLTIQEKNNGVASFSKGIIGSPIKLTLESLHKAPMFQIKAMPKPGRNAYKMKSMDPSSKMTTSKLRALDDKPHLKFWNNHENMVSPQSAARTPISGLIGHSFTSANNSVESFNKNSSPNKTKIKSKQATLGQIASKLASLQEQQMLREENEAAASAAEQERQALACESKLSKATSKNSSQQLVMAQQELTLSLQTVKKQLLSPEEKLKQQQTIKEREKAQRKKESSNYLNQVKVSKKPPVERLFEVNLEPEPQPKYGSIEDEPLQEHEHGHFAETFYLESRAETAQSQNFQETRQEVTAGASKLSQVSGGSPKRIDFNQYGGGDLVSGQPAAQQVLKKHEYVPEQILQQLKSMTMDSSLLNNSNTKRVGGAATNNNMVFGNVKIFVGGERPAMVTKREELYQQYSLLHQSPQVQSPQLVASPDGDSLLTARYVDTKVSLIKNNAAVRRHDAAVKENAPFRGGQKRVSPLWLDKVDPDPYMRRDRFALARRDKNELPQEMLETQQQQQQNKQVVSKRQLVKSPPQQQSLGSSKGGSPPIKLQQKQQRQVINLGIPPHMQATSMQHSSAQKQTHLHSQAEIVMPHQTVVLENVQLGAGSQAYSQMNFEEFVQLEHMIDERCADGSTLEKSGLGNKKNNHKKVVQPPINNVNVMLPIESQTKIIVQDSLNGVNKKMTELLGQQQNRRQTKVQDLLSSYASSSDQLSHREPTRQIELNKVVFDDSKFKDLNRSVDHQTTQHQPALKPHKHRKQKKRQDGGSNQNSELSGLHALTERMHTGDCKNSQHRNLYGNITGTQRITTSVASSKTNSKASHGGGDDSKSQFLSELYSRGSIGNQSSVGVPQLPGLPQSPTKKHKRSLIKEVDNHLYSNETRKERDEADTPRVHRQGGGAGTTSQGRMNLLDLKSIEQSRRQENRSYSPSTIKAGNKIISAINDRSRQIQLTLLKSQGSDELIRMSTVSAASSENRLAEEKKEALAQMVSARRLPTVSQLHAASFEGKYQGGQQQQVQSNENVGKPSKGHNYFECSVPSHIVPPKKRATKDLRNSSMSANSHRSGAKEKKNLPKVKYADVKREMLAKNQDPSRDVLQTLLNPYEGFDDVTERSPHPFQIKKKSTSLARKQGNRKHSVNATPAENPNKRAVLQSQVQNTSSQDETMKPQKVALSVPTSTRSLHQHNYSKRTDPKQSNQHSQTMKLALEIQKEGSLTLAQSISLVKSIMPAIQQQQLAAEKAKIGGTDPDKNEDDDDDGEDDGGPIQPDPIYNSAPGNPKRRVVHHSRHVSDPAAQESFKTPQLTFPEIVNTSNAAAAGHNRSLEKRQSTNPSALRYSRLRVTPHGIASIGKLSLQDRLEVVLSNAGCTGGTIVAEAPIEEAMPGVIGQRATAAPILRFNTDGNEYDKDAQVGVTPKTFQSRSKVPYRSPYAQNIGLAAKRGSRDSQFEQNAHGAGRESNMQKKFERTMDQFSPWD